MTNIQEIYKQLFDGSRITVRCDKRTAEAIRVALCKRHQQSVAFDLSSDSVCMDPTETGATYWLGKRRAKSLEFEIESIQRPLEQD